MAKTKRPKEKECVMDIWGSQSQKIKTKKELLGLEQKVERVATRGTVISGPVAVTTANALSYNPTHTEHQKLLDRALKEEVRIMEEAERINSMINPAEVSCYSLRLCSLFRCLPNSFLPRKRKQLMRSARMMESALTHR